MWQDRHLEDNASIYAILNQPAVISAFSLLLAVLGATGVVFGIFEGYPRISPWAQGLAGTMMLVSMAYILLPHRRQAALSADRVRIELLILWSVTLWVVHRALFNVGGQGIILVTAFLAWLFLTNSLHYALSVVSLILTIEISLTLLGLQRPATFLINLFFFSLTIAATLIARQRFSSSTAKAGPNRETPRHSAETLTAKAPAFQAGANKNNVLFPVIDRQHQLVTANFCSSTSSLLESLRKAIGLTTVAVLWPAPDNTLNLLAVASTRTDLLTGPFVAGRGITGALLKDTGEIAISTIRPEFPELPYYRNLQGVGSILGLRHDVGGGQQPSSPEARYAMLFCDRERADTWKDKDRDALRLALQKVAADRHVEELLQRTEGEREAIFRVCNCLRRLNGALGLDSVYAATAEAVREIAPIDFLAVSLQEGTTHRVAYIEGKNVKNFQDKSFPVADGLVGQALKVRHWLPAGATYPEAAPIFSESTRFTGLNSLLILPLIQEGGAPIGALTVAAAGKGIFTPARRELFELLAAQVAVKLDLAQAHEQITRLATTDGLTGLANHRTFQHAFNIMIERAIRNQCPLCLILCDIDHFKKVNDTYGHPFGDRVLMEVSRILAGQVRKVDLAARYGGEEFAVLLEGADEKGGKMQAERIRQRVEQLVILHEREQVKVTMSLGLAFCPKDGEEKSKLIERADQALYKAKSSGRNRTVTWSEVETN